MRAVFSKKKCRVCSKSFIGKASDKTCSEECENIRHSHDTRVCPVCGAEFKRHYRFKTCGLLSCRRNVNALS